ncbi:PTS cellobiose transporter subunit IIC [uncultured Fusobacterium sp.]|uniref:PTS cellobiose transporter subunit IIC n=1 Tax=uncultured Fusobacterium sp. TaxID=159267 RepID=UPI0015A6BE8C|nr:PTS cellobiose transporter subunit IIC [uncultured Fusobacterium sp.]
MSLFDKFNVFLEEKFMPVAAKVGSQKHVQAIRDGLVLSMPLTIAGSIFLILAFLPISGYDEFMKGIFGDGWMGKVLYPVRGTFDIMAIFGCIGVSYRLAEKNKVDCLSSVALALMTFMILTPFKVSFMNNTVEAIPLMYTGSAGLFGAIISSIISVEIYTWFIRKNIVIKMPENVPAAVAKSFVALIPTLALMIGTLVVRLILENTSLQNVHELLKVILTTPLKTLVGSWWGLAIIIAVIQLFWIAGLHGSTIILGMIGPVLGLLGDQNRLAYEAGAEIPNIIGGPFFDIFISLGGGGGTFALAFLLAFVSRSRQLKEIGKISVGAAFFNINEPIIFGLPIVMNPYLIIPFFITPLVTGLIGYFSVATGLLPKLPGISVPWTTPPLISGYLASIGSFRYVILQVILIVIGMIIYLPFFKAFDNKILEDEKM